MKAYEILNYYFAATGIMLMNLSRKILPSYFFCLFSVKLTCPSIVAKIVKSLPIPTFSPGKNFVPFCLTIIAPAVTLCPPKTLTPLRLATESRPFLLDPPAFLCDIAFLVKTTGILWYGR